MVSSSTDDPGPATARDTLWFWLVVAVAVTVAAGVGLVGPSGYALLALLHAPAVAATLLAARAALRLARGAPTALWVGRRAILGGVAALLLPLLFLLAWTVVRETGRFSARLTRSSGHLESRTQWSTARTSGGGTVAVDPAVVTADGVELVVDDGVLQDRIAAALRDLDAALPGADLRGRVTVRVDPPFALAPLWKTAQLTCEVEAEFYVERHDEKVMLRGGVTTDGRWTMLGFASQRNFREYVGDELGKRAREHLLEKVREMASDAR